MLLTLLVGPHEGHQPVKQAAQLSLGSSTILSGNMQLRTGVRRGSAIVPLDRASVVPIGCQ